MADFGVLVGTAQTAAGGVAQIKGVIDKLRGVTPPNTGANSTGSLNYFRSQFLHANNILRNNRFLVTIPTPKLFPRDSNRSILNLDLVCNSGTLPGVSVSTSEIRRHGIGPVEKRPYSVNFIDLNLSFIIDGRGGIHRFFTLWMDGIVRFDRLVTNPDNRPFQQPYEVAYRDEYVTDIIIYIYDDKSRQVYKVTAYNAFPLFMGDINLNWGATDDYVILPVTFGYTSWKSEILDISPEASTENKPGWFEKLAAAGAALNLLSTIRRPQSISDVLNIVNNTSSAASGLVKALK
jgi:hypothetical protein